MVWRCVCLLCETREGDRNCWLTRSELKSSRGASGKADNKQTTRRGSRARINDNDNAARPPRLSQLTSSTFATNKSWLSSFLPVRFLSPTMESQVDFDINEAIRLYDSEPASVPTPEAAPALLECENDPEALSQINLINSELNPVVDAIADNPDAITNPAIFDTLQFLLKYFLRWLPL